jgi:predicted kinase
VLVIMSGLPATGKSAIAGALAAAIGAVHLRVDVIEQAVVSAGAGTHPLGSVGYEIAYRLAEDFLRQGLTVVADSVNPLSITRQAWREVAGAAAVDYLDIEVVCSDPVVHERRVSGRVADVPGLVLPSWPEILSREYEPWDQRHLVLDTAHAGVAGCVAQVRSAIPGPDR